MPSSGLIDAVLIGDSHAATINSACKAQGLRFAAAVTMSAENYVGAVLTTDPNGQLRLHLGAPSNPVRAEKLAKRAAKVSAELNYALSLGKPVYTTIGMAGHLFVRDLGPALDASVEQLEVRARVSFASYLDIHAALLRRAPAVTAVFAPTRFTTATRNAWQVYERTVQSMLNEIDIAVLDLRNTMAGDDGALRREFAAVDDRDRVHAGPLWGETVFAAIKRDIAGRL